MSIKAGIIALAAAFTPHANAAEPAAPRVCEMPVADFDDDSGAAYAPPPPLLGPGITHITLAPRKEAASAPKTPAPHGCM